MVNRQRTMAFWPCAGSLLLLIFFTASTWAGHLDHKEASDNSHYGQCVGRVINHPMRAEFALSQFSSEFYDNTDAFCRCMVKVETKERQRSEKEKLSYFFSGRQGYFSEVDSCVLNNVNETNYSFFNASLTYDYVVPLIHHQIKKTQNPGVMVVLGRGPASVQKDCLTMEVMKSCQKIKSLFFTYKCLKSKFKDISFFEKIEKACHGESWPQGQRI